MDFLDELLEHLLGDSEVGNHTIFHWPDGGDVAGCASKHLFGGEPDLLNGFLATRAALLFDRNNGRLVQNDTLSPHVNQRIRRTEVDGDVV